MQQRAGFLEQIKEMDSRFWIMNTIEMFERLAYYGVRAVVAIYMVLPLEMGGPEFNHVQKGTIFAWWAGVQSVLPMFIGGYADRYGHKRTIAVAITIAISGYITMGICKSYPGFFTGAILLALGTAVIKPGIQGTIAATMKKSSASVGWGIFYQLVNIGGFLGPLLAGVLRLMDWKYVFFACAFVAAINYLWLPFYEDPSKHFKKDASSPFLVFLKSLSGILRPRIFFFCLIFSGFWLMFNQVFDLLPNSIDDWVDSSGVLSTLGSLFSSSTLTELAAQGKQVNPEWIINLNPALIVCTMVFFGYLTSFLRPLTSIILGMSVATIGTIVAGTAVIGWAVIGGILIFSIGEMLSSPKKLEYFSSISPKGQEGLYMGYANIPVAIGWIAGSKIAGHLYETTGDKVNLAREHLINVLGVSSEQVASLQKSEVMQFLASKMNVSVIEAQQMLFDTYKPYTVWLYIAAMGVISIIGMIVYDRFIVAYDKRKTRMSN